MDETRAFLESVGLPRGDLHELLTVVLASPRATQQPQPESVAPRTRELLQGAQRELVAALREMGGHADFLLDGSLIAVFRKWGSATDQADSRLVASHCRTPPGPAGVAQLTPRRSAVPDRPVVGYFR